ncbi:MAG: transporter [Verrucomicrobia bacterium]|nr:transporter [Verrucomicrobiota bacterium]
MNTSHRNLLTTLTLLVSLPALSVAFAEDWSAKAPAPVTNPVFFEEPFIRSEIRPLFMYQHLGKTLPVGGAGATVPVGGNVQVYAMEIRWAVTERLAIIATKDGYVNFNPAATLTKASGWADISLGLKYAVIDDRENQFILTPGVELELPTGNRDVFQGNGQGEWDIFLAAAKGWGDLTLMGNIGARVPNNMARDTAQLHYSAQLGYHAHRYFVPFVAANGFTVLNAGQQEPFALGVEGFDLINFGSKAAAGSTQVALGCGFRSKLHEKVELGFAYERSVTNPRGVLDDRFTVDFVLRF